VIQFPKMNNVMFLKKEVKGVAMNE